jgi:hypothetical protein
MAASCNDVTGQWVSIQPFPLGLAVILNLTQDSSGNITGSGTVQGPGSPVAPCQVVAPSSNIFPQTPNVTITLNVQGLGQATLSGNFASNCTQICGSVGTFGNGCVQRQSGPVPKAGNLSTSKKKPAKKPGKGKKKR